MVDGVFTMISASDLKLEVPDFTEPTDFENLGTTVEVIAKGGSLEIAATTYELRQFHFHLPSEHLDNGTSIASKSFPSSPPYQQSDSVILTTSPTVEMHMVFESPEKQIAVIGIFIDLDNGGAQAAPLEAPIVAPAPVAKNKRAGFFSRRQEAVIAPAPPVEGSFGGTQGFLTMPMIKAPGISSPMLEAVFSKVGEIATPGTKTTVGPLAMTEVVKAVLLGGFQRYVSRHSTNDISASVSWWLTFMTKQLLGISHDAALQRGCQVVGRHAEATDTDGDV